MASDLAANHFPGILTMVWVLITHTQTFPTKSHSSRNRTKLTSPLTTMHSRLAQFLNATSMPLNATSMPPQCHLNATSIPHQCHFNVTPISYTLTMILFLSCARILITPPILFYHERHEKISSVGITRLLSYRILSWPWVLKCTVDHGHTSPSLLVSWGLVVVVDCFHGMRISP